MKSVKITIIALSALILAGCAADHSDGVCKTAVDGACMQVYMNGVAVPSGDVDMRFTGIKMVAPHEISGTVSTTAREWKTPGKNPNL